MGAEKIEVNKIPNDRLDGLIQKMIKNLEIRKDKGHEKRPDTDDLWTNIAHLMPGIPDFLTSLSEVPKKG